MSIVKRSSKQPYISTISPFLLLRLGEVLNLPPILLLVLLVEIEGFKLGGALKIGFVGDQFLDAQEDLFYCDGGLPVLLLKLDMEYVVQDG